MAKMTVEMVQMKKRICVVRNSNSYYQLNIQVSCKRNGKVNDFGTGRFGIVLV